MQPELYGKCLISQEIESLLIIFPRNGRQLADQYRRQAVESRQSQLAEHLRLIPQ